jgi:transcriptional regulator with XRE-family HTH domain
MALMTREACRADRTLLDWSQTQLAAATGVSAVRNFEAGRSVPTANNLGAMRRAMEAAGVESLENGVRLKAVFMPASGTGNGALPITGPTPDEPAPRLTRPTG